MQMLYGRQGFTWNKQLQYKRIFAGSSMKLNAQLLTPFFHLSPLSDIMDLGQSEEDDDDDSETIAIQKEAARTLTVKGFHWARSFIDEVTEICRNSNLFRKASLQKASIASG